MTTRVDGHSRPGDFLFYTSHVLITYNKVLKIGVFLEQVILSSNFFSEMTLNLKTWARSFKLKKQIQFNLFCLQFDVKML